MRKMFRTCSISGKRFGKTQFFTGEKVQHDDQALGLSGLGRPSGGTAYSTEPVSQLNVLHSFRWLASSISELQSQQATVSDAV